MEGQPAVNSKGPKTFNGARKAMDASIFNP
jgi:hypothetical protein